MKKIFLLFVACTTFVCVKAQQTSAAKVSTSTGRWYNYGGDCLFRMWDASTSGVDEYGTLLANMWFDTSSICVYPTGALVDHFLSYAALLHPWATTFNDTTIYGPGIIGVTPTNAYTIDSMEVVGLYHRNTIATVSYVDTLRVSWVEGNNISGDIAGGKIVHDSLNNVAKMTNHVDILLGPADVTDTDAFYRGGSKGYIGFVHKRVALPAPFAVPAMHYTGGSVTFRSGDPSAPSISPAHGFGDTVYTGNPANPYKYGAWSPLIVYHTTTGTTTADWPPPHAADSNAGNFKSEPIPRSGGWYTSGYLMDSVFDMRYQYTTVGFYINCPSCPLLGPHFPALEKEVRASLPKVIPNPANERLDISFTQTTNETAIITLSNMIGQVVASQSVTNGKAILSTSELPAGVYLYTIETGGTVQNGRVVVSH